MPKLSLIEKLSSVTEELGEIVTITKGDDVRKPDLSLKHMVENVESSVGAQVPATIFAIFKLFAVQNLMRGRMQLTAYSFGKQIGMSFKVKTAGELLKETQRFGIGRPRIVSMDDNAVQVRITSSLTSIGVEGAQHPICYFEAGLLAGGFEKLMRRKVDFIEKTCCAQGDDSCTFQAKLTTEKHSKFAQFPMETEEYSQENIKFLTSLATHAITAIENSLLFESAKRQSMIDGLTQIYNHRYFQHFLRIESSRAMRHKTPVVLVMMDIDNFKRFNDRLGHLRGDNILKSVANALVEHVREIDIVARYGGDEFAIILPQTDAFGAHVVVKRIKDDMQRLFLQGHLRKSNVNLGICMGVAVANGKKKFEPSELFHRADMALLSAKSKGKGKVIFERKDL